MSEKQGTVHIETWEGGRVELWFAGLFAGFTPVPCAFGEGWWSLLFVAASLCSLHSARLRRQAFEDQVALRALGVHRAFTVAISARKCEDVDSETP